MLKGFSPVEKYMAQFLLLEKLKVDDVPTVKNMLKRNEFNYLMMKIEDDWLKWCLFGNTSRINRSTFRVNVEK